MAGFGKLGSKQYCLGETEGATSPGPFPSERIVTWSSFLSCSPWGLENSGFALSPPSNTDQGGGGLETKCFSCSEGKREEIERHARECAMLVSEQEGRQKHLWRFSFDAILRESEKKRFTNTSVRGQVPEQQNASLCEKQCLI